MQFIRNFLEIYIFTTEMMFEEHVLIRKVDASLMTTTT